MGYPQTYYTSCQSGLGSSGFQFNAATPQIASDVMDHLQRLGGYSPPLSAPTNWTPEQLEEFPVSLIFARLSDSRNAIGQSKYIGADYSGRRNGNYFTHFLIVDDGAARNEQFYPIELWRSSIWSTQESTTTDLPLLANIDLTGTIDFDGIVAFLNQNNRLVYFEQMLSAALAALDGGRRLIIVDDNEAVAQWIAAVSFALPPELAWRLTFTTYSKEPARVDAMVVGTTVDCDFGFTPLEMDHTFAVFDFVKRRFSQIMPTPFASFVTQAFSNGAGAKIAGFGVFVTDSATDTAPTNLAPAFLAYSILKDFPVSGGDRISDIEVCKWCIDNPIILTEKLTLRLLDRLAVEDLARPEALDAFHQLYRTVAAKSFLATVHSRFMDIFIDQLFKAGPELLVASGKDLAVSNTPRLEQAQKFVDRATTVTDAMRLCRCLRIGDQFGWLTFSTPLHKRLVDQVAAVVAPSLSGTGATTTVINVLLETCDGAAGTILLEGIISLLGQRAGDSAFFSSLLPLTSRPAVFDKIDRLTREKHLYQLAGRMSAQKTSTAPNLMPLDRFKEVLHSMQALKSDLQPDDCEFAFHLIWERQQPSAGDSLWLLRELPKNVSHALSETQILATISEALVQRLDPVERLETMQGDEIILLKTLFDRTGQREVGLEIYKDPITALQLRFLVSELRGEEYIAAWLKKSWEVAARLSPVSRSRLLKVAAPQLITLENVDKHIKLLQTGLENFGNDVAEPYALFIQQTFGKTSDKEAFLRVCEVWLRLLTLKKNIRLSPIGDALVTAFQGFDKASQSAIENGIEQNPTLWSIWQGELQSRASMAAKIKNWITTNVLRK